MTEYELDAVRTAFEAALRNGAPGLAEVVRKAIANGAIIRLRYSFNIPAKPLNIRIEDTSLA